MSPQKPVPEMKIVRAQVDEPALAGAIPSDNKRTPRLGLALGAGAAKGWAHIGVMRRLEEGWPWRWTCAGSSISSSR
jgi:hypothetical protein